ncbi:hypothetical protein QIS99_19795 [Streptomyces sp. B-S-A8]|uniref:Uncharacterized protein n=1 Tax=Streptomyces solicavernae TaxID=3043614 RepID=A0ABT6RVF9_9ACTN|nr:hypothetical protein [Streptomyces sp. B-S-A8]MDI3388430.1 hypothetical protein [Streptomyces sp. B-S-A8]
MATGQRFHIDRDGHSVTVQVSGGHGTVEILVDGKVVAYRRELGRETAVLDAELPDDPPRPFRILIAPVAGVGEPPLCLMERDHTRYLLPLTPQPPRPDRPALRGLGLGLGPIGVVRVLRRRIRRIRRMHRVPGRRH